MALLSSEQEIVDWVSDLISFPSPAFALTSSCSRIPLAVLAVGSLCTSAVGNFYGVRCVLETSKPAIDIIYLFKILDRMRKLIKAASILEFSVVAAVSCLSDNSADRSCCRFKY